MKKTWRGVVCVSFLEKRTIGWGNPQPIVSLKLCVATALRSNGKWKTKKSFIHIKIHRIDYIRKFVNFTCKSECQNLC